MVRGFAVFWVYRDRERERERERARARERSVIDNQEVTGEEETTAGGQREEEKEVLFEGLFTAKAVSTRWTRSNKEPLSHHRRSTYVSFDTTQVHRHGREELDERHPCGPNPRQKALKL